MSKYTIELRTLLAQGFNIFDFDYTRTPESQAIISNEELQQGFIDHYFFNEVGFETLERFKHNLKVQWKEALGEFDALLVAYNKDIDVLSNYSNEINTLNADKDTPKSSIDIMAQLEKPSFLATIKSKSKGKQAITDIELLEIYHNKIKDIQTEFYESLEGLFMQIF